VAFGVVIVLSVWLPLQEMNENYSPETYTRNLITQELLRIKRSDGDFESSSVIAEIAAENENLRVYFESGDTVFEYGEPPKWRGYVDFSHPDLLGVPDDVPCGSSQAFASAKFIDRFGTEGTFFLRKCGQDSFYLEIAGVQNPSVRSDNWVGLFPEPIFWSNLSKPALSATAVLIAALLIATFGLRSMSRVARAADSIEPDDSNIRLPESGVPVEVIPFVGAINRLLQDLESARESQELFLASAAHEIRTPLAIMRVRIEDIPDETTRETLRNDVRKLSGIVEDLLRLLSVRNRGHPDSHVDLVELVRDTVADRAPIAIENEVDVGMNTAIPSLVIQGDDRLLRYVFTNLIDNAVSVSQPGDAIDVVIAEDGEVAIQDHGPGVPAESRELIFEPFSKHPPNRKGHGLGLAISKAIVDIHAGELRVEDTPGGGATFVVKV
jgi:signal transduction histidine kinase